MAVVQREYRQKTRKTLTRQIIAADQSNAQTEKDERFAPRDVEHGW